MLILTCHYFGLLNVADAWNEEGFYECIEYARFKSLYSWIDHKKKTSKEEAIWDGQCETCLCAVESHATGCPEVA